MAQLALATEHVGDLDEIKSLTGGNDRAFYLITRLAKPRIRNAIAHGTIWRDAEEEKARYTEGGRQRREYEIALLEFGCFALSGSHLGEA